VAASLRVTEAEYYQSLVRMLYDKKDSIFEPFLCRKEGCINHNGKAIDDSVEKRERELSPSGDLVKRLGYTAAVRWYDAGRKPIKICRLKWITTRNGYCEKYVNNGLDNEE